MLSMAAATVLDPNDVSMAAGFDVSVSVFDPPLTFEVEGGKVVGRE